MTERLNFFTSNIGKVIFRNKLDIGEDTQYLTGVKVMSEKHAKGLYALEVELDGLIIYSSEPQHG
jgi:hypothetical protein